jgi:hypothetical protein
LTQKLAAILARLVLVLVVAAVVAALQACVIGVFARAAGNTTVSAWLPLEATQRARFALAGIREPTAVVVFS